MWGVVLDATIDSLKILIIIFIAYIVISVIEGLVSKKINLKSKLSPLYGGLIGVIPQCGFSVVATDLYVKRHITIGTLFSVYIACSDEAIPILLSNPSGIKMILPLLFLKFILSFIVGYIIDCIFYGKNKQIESHQHECTHVDEIHKGCCDHSIEEDTKIKKFFIHPLIHSLKIFIFIYAVNLIFGTIVYLIGEKALYSFLDKNYYVLPVVSSLIGLIPNCASSVIISELLISGALPFSAAFSGLCCNAGLGIVYLIKNNKKIKESFYIILTLFLISILFGYFVMGVEFIFNI